MSWHVATGEILGIIGPNGAGKSSCFAAVTHAVHRQGDVWLAGEKVTALPTYELARLGLRRTFQHNAFFGDLTLLENAMAAMLREHSTSLPSAIALPWRGDRRAPSRRNRQLPRCCRPSASRAWTTAKRPGGHRLWHAAPAVGRAGLRAAGDGARAADRRAGRRHRRRRHEAARRPSGRPAPARGSPSW